MEKETGGVAWEAVLVHYLIASIVRTPKLSPQRVPEIIHPFQTFFLLYYSELFCFSELPCVGCSNPTDSRMGDDESLSKCRFFFLFFFPFSNAEGIKSVTLGRWHCLQQQHLSAAVMPEPDCAHGDTQIPPGTTQP